MRKLYGSFKGICRNVFLQHQPLYAAVMHSVHPSSKKAVFYSHAQHTETKAKNAELTEGYRTIPFAEGRY